MHGVPADLNLAGLVGALLYQVTWREHSVEFVFNPTDGPIWTINVEGGWELRDSFGEIVDRAMEHRDRNAFFVGRNIGQAVQSSRVSAPAWFELIFANGSILRILDDSKQYESFSIQPGDLFV